ncbi:MAG: winged helix-turn-helix transcriptional regulator [Candidatus Bathyarchaeia archaeon]
MRKISILRKSGTLPILCFLFKSREARYSHLAHETSVPLKTLAIRLTELLRLGLIDRQIRQEGQNGVAFHVYGLTSKGTKIVRSIGYDLIERLVKAENDFVAVESGIERKLKVT